MTPEIAVLWATFIVGDAAMVGLTTVWLMWMGILPKRDHQGY